MKKISFLGLGIMGNSIAKHLLHENSEIIVFNRNKKKSLLFKRKFKNKNVKVVDNPSEAASNSDFIFSCVGNDMNIKTIPKKLMTKVKIIKHFPHRPVNPIR